MLINSVTIENFRCYYGSNTVDFNTEGKVTLIFGDSGFGKTSFLQFFNWMFYSSPDFGKDNDQPLYNTIACDECDLNKTFNVYGQVDFEHFKKRYSLRKKEVYRAKYPAAQLELTEYNLYELIDDNWSPSRLNKQEIEQKINTILPKELSKYFLLNGEKAAEIVLDKKALKPAIHSLFGLDAYEEAISHIGRTGKKSSVLGILSEKMANSIKKTNNNDPYKLKTALENLYETIDKNKKRLEAITLKIKDKRDERDRLFTKIGQRNSEEQLLSAVDSNKRVIDQLIARNKEILLEIGKISYQSYPYLLLAQQTSDSSEFLRRMNAEYLNAYKNIFENLRADLLEEIIEKDTCVCGRSLDDSSKEYIEGVLKSMPPRSYSYLLGQFASKATTQVQVAKATKDTIENLYDTYMENLRNIHKAEEANKGIEEAIKELEKDKDQIAKLDSLDEEISLEQRKEATLRTTIAQDEQKYAIWKRDYDKALSNAEVSSEFKEKRDFFETVKETLEKEKAEKEIEVKNELNNCVRETFKLLTTQTGLDADKMEFIDNDFTLRSVFLTGGQKSVDVYSYVIGIVKAMQKCNKEYDDNLIIVDAPFAFTDSQQSTHIFKTLPTAVQTILLTLDINKIREELLTHPDMYDLYLLNTSESQNKASIERGDINDIDF
ncbi:MAG: AAA family ATPase [Eubacterium coprostanoligenes]|nr:AAA family ATPase [Eubacterium coprostanoligenes]